MLRTLFSRMLAAYLSVIIIVLIALGFMASSIFHDHYIEKIKSELVREADAICRIVLEEYMDDAISDEVEKRVRDVVGCVERAQTATEKAIMKLERR